MKKSKVLQVGGITALTSAAVLVGLVAMKRHARTQDQAGRWHTLTVNLPLAKVAPKGNLPTPLYELGDKIEVRFTPAPGDRGTEVAVRLTDVKAHQESAGAQLEELRRALRDTRSILETGEVLEPSSPGSSKTTLLKWPTNIVTGKSKEEGRL
ncbi:MAG TPA: hypothetical protein VF572_06615 [Candidatus Saccharimonadales bacterium]|jgi:hypothetical protein